MEEIQGGGRRSAYVIRGLVPGEPFRVRPDDMCARGTVGMNVCGLHTTTERIHQFQSHTLLDPLHPLSISSSDSCPSPDICATYTISAFPLRPPPTYQPTSSPTTRETAESLERRQQRKASPAWLRLRVEAVLRFAHRDG
jgi:hypothetical protein